MNEIYQHQISGSDALLSVAAEKLGTLMIFFVVVVVVVECHGKQTACSDAYTDAATMKGLKNMKKEMQNIIK